MSATGGTDVVNALRALSVDISTLVLVAVITLLAFGPSLVAWARR